MFVCSSTRSTAEADAAMIAQLQEQLKEKEAALQSLENPIMQADSESESVSSHPLWYVIVGLWGVSDGFDGEFWAVWVGAGATGERSAERG